MKTSRRFTAFLVAIFAIPLVCVAVIASNPPQGGGHTKVKADVSGPLTPFGEMLTAEINPDVQIDAVYGVNTEEHETFTASTGSVTTESTLFVCSTGATSGSYAVLRSKRSVRYRPGQGIIGRFTASYTTPVASSQQMAGVFTAEHGLWIGYNGTDFGICRQNGAALEIQTLTVTAAAGGTESVTVTLNGTDYTFNVSAGTTAGVASEIAAQSYTGWNAYQVTTVDSVSTVVFVATAVGDKTGSFAFVNNAGGGTANALFHETQAGAGHTETWVTQNNFNLDKLDGTGASGMTLDPTKLNVWQIGMQWLGAGSLTFSIENPTTGLFFPFHRIAYANANTAPSITNPALKVGWVAYSLGSTTDLAVRGASAALMVTGPSVSLRDAHGTSNTKSGISTTLTNVLTVRASAILRGVIHLGKLNPLFATVGVEGTKPAEIQVIINATLAGTPNWTQVSAHSGAEVDTAGTTVSGGSVIYAAAVGKSGNVTLDFTRARYAFKLERTDTLTIAVKSSASTEASASITWADD